MKEYQTKINDALEQLGHKLKRDENDNVDIFVMDFQPHNGPGCELCHDSWCHHCLTLEQIEIMPRCAGDDK